MLGELLITAGVLTLLYVGWQLWIGDMIFGGAAQRRGQDLSEPWEQEYAAPLDRSPDATPSPTPSADASPLRSSR